jgi:adenine/guanine/hypoxanthine permease
MNAISRYFRLAEAGSSIRVEILAGVTTFLTMAYIIVVQPAVLSGQMFGFATGMDFGSVMVATCVAAALGSVLMGLLARYPIALAPGMGENFFFVFSAIPLAAQLPAVVAGETTAWQVAMGVVLISGMLFLLVSVLGLRSALINAISPSLKHGIATGIGLFIAFIGMQNAGLIVKNPGTAVSLNPHFGSPDLMVFFFGLLVAAVLQVRRVRGALLLGILAAAALTIILRLTLSPEAHAESMLFKQFALAHAVVAAPPSLSPTAFKFDLVHALSQSMIPLIIIFLFMDIFDTIGTLVGVGRQAGLIQNNQLVRGERAMLADAGATVLGACLGTSTVTSFIESASGVEQGGRTGLTAIVTGLCFLLALPFAPVVAMIGSYPPITAAALVLVGAMMMSNVREIIWDDYSEAIPAFLIILGIPLSYSIADGIALGVISFVLIKVGSGRWRQVPWLMHGLGVVLLLYFLLIRAPLAK